MSKVIYMDNNATTRVAPEVFEEMSPYFCDLYGNPSSMHTFGGQVGSKVEQARQRVAKLINADPEEIVFTSCGTESDSTAIFSALQSNPEKRHVVTTRVEHPAVKNLSENLDHLIGHKHMVTQLPVDEEGMLDFEQYKESLTDETAIVSVMWANNETGVIFPIAEMAALAKERGILFIQMRCRLWARCLLMSKRSRWTFFPSPAISSTPPRAPASSISERAHPLLPFSSAAIKSLVVGVEPKMSRLLSALVRPVNWQVKICPRRTPPYACCETSLRKVC